MNHVDTVHECDRDRRTDRITITKTVQRIASHGNKMLMRAAIVVQVLQDLFYVLLYVLFYYSFYTNYTSRAQPRFKNWGCPSFFQTLQMFNYSSQKASREEKLGGCPPPQPTRGSGGASRCLGQSSSHKRFLGISYTILQDFTHLLVHLTAVWKWEIPTSLYWLVGVMFPFNFVRHPNFNFWVCPDTHSGAVYSIHNNFSVTLKHNVLRTNVVVTGPRHDVMIADTVDSFHHHVTAVPHHVVM